MKVTLSEIKKNPQGTREKLREGSHDSNQQFGT